MAKDDCATTRLSTVEETIKIYTLLRQVNSQSSVMFCMQQKANIHCNWH